MGVIPLIRRVGPKSTGLTEGSAAGGSTTTGLNGATWYDRSYTVDNGVYVFKLGTYSVNAVSGELRIANRPSAGTYNTVAAVSFSHTGSGWEDFTLSAPYLVAASGNYYCGVYPTSGTINYNTLLRAFKAGDSTGSGFTEDGPTVMASTRVTY